jgi:hypothetical protein
MNNTKLITPHHNIFPKAVSDLLKALYSHGFFNESMFVGSWVMLLYKAAFGITYELSTHDIDFAVAFPRHGNTHQTDLEKIITDLGYSPVPMLSGVRKYSREAFSVEFMIQRKGGRNDDYVLVRQWNVIAEPLPFLDILFNFPFIAGFGEFCVRAPIPEAYFFQKLIVASKRSNQGKRDKDYDQCAIISRHLDQDQLTRIVKSQKISAKYKNALKKSCRIIDFPPQNLGL